MSNPSPSVSLSSPSHPAQPGGEPIVCQQCEAANSPQTRFCGSCGTRLWEPCPACAEPAIVTRRFCGSCGGDLHESLQEVVEQVNHALAKSERLASEGRYLEAVALLEPVQLVEHTTLAPLGERVVQQREDLEARRDAALQEITGQLNHAKEAFAEGELRRALEIVEQTPEALRNSELRELHRTLKGRVEQADRLRLELKQGLKAKKLEGLAATARALLELEPNDEQVVQLSAKLESKQQQIDRATSVALLQKACEALKACDYGTAQQALDRMPNVELSEEHAGICRGAAERVWLANLLGRSIYLDPICMKAAERFAKLQPHDAKAGGLLDTLAKIRKEAMASRPGQPIIWRKKRTAAGLPGGPVALSPIPAILAPIAASQGVPAGQLLTAFGLALESVGAGQYRLDLIPKKRSWLASRGRRSKPTASEGWGIDVGAAALKAVRLRRDADGALSVEEIVCLRYGRPGDARSKPELPFGTPDYVATTLAAFLNDRDLSATAVTLGTPGPWTLARCFQLPFIDDAKFDEAVRYEARMRIPLEPDKVMFDRIVTPLPEEKDLDARAVTLVACARSHIATLQDWLVGVRCKSVQITSGCVALLNVARQLQKESAAPGSVAMIDLGAKTCNIAVAHPGGCWLRGLYHGADLADHELVKRRRLSWDAAEKLRREPWRVPWMHEVDADLAPFTDQLCSALERSFSQFYNESVATIEQRLLCGGAAPQIGLLRRLSSAD